MQLAWRAIAPLARALGLGLLALVLLPGAAARAAGTQIQPPPALQAQEAILIETDLGTRVYALHPNREVAIASTTKLMTAYVTLELEPLTRKLVEQPYTPSEPDESLAHLPPGVRYSVADLLRAMLLPSGNDVAHTLALDVGGTSAHFVSLMNAAAANLGLSDTHYTTPIGLDTPGNYSTAANLATLAQDLLKDPFFAAVVDEPSAYLPGGVEVSNTNDLIGAYPFVVGVKTGHTADAGYCLVGAASWHGVHLISVVLGDPTDAGRDDDTLALLRYGLYLYHHVRVAVKGRSYESVPVNGSTQTVSLVATRDAGLVVSRAAAFSVTLAGVPTQLQGPIAAGTPEGTIDVSENGQSVLSIPLVTAVAVASPPASSSLLYVAAIILLVALGGCSLRVMRRRASRAERRRTRA
jgi:D-alanyl-D-alanine carboxypeptidase (penicillin-binding protein 5/6)